MFRGKPPGDQPLFSIRLGNAHLVREAVLEGRICVGICSATPSFCFMLVFLVSHSFFANAVSLPVGLPLVAFCIPSTPFRGPEQPAPEGDPRQSRGCGRVRGPAPKVEPRRSPLEDASHGRKATLQLRETWSVFSQGVATSMCHVLPRCHGSKGIPSVSVRMSDIEQFVAVNRFPLEWILYRSTTSLPPSPNDRCDSWNKGTGSRVIQVGSPLGKRPVKTRKM